MTWLHQMAFECPGWSLWRVRAENGGFHLAAAQSGPVATEQSLASSCREDMSVFGFLTVLKLLADVTYTAAPAETPFGFTCVLSILCLGGCECTEGDPQG